MSLTLQTRITYEVHEVLNDAMLELRRACGKHPLFPNEMTLMTADGIRNKLAIERMLNDQPGGECATAESVIKEEYYEFLEAVVDRDPDKARTELVQTIAMLLRAYVHLGYYCRAV